MAVFYGICLKMQLNTKLSFDSNKSLSYEFRVFFTLFFKGLTLILQGTHSLILLQHIFRL